MTPAVPITHELTVTICAMTSRHMVVNVTTMVVDASIFMTVTQAFAYRKHARMKQPPTQSSVFLLCCPVAK